MANVHGWRGPGDTHVLDPDEIQALREEARALAEEEFGRDCWEVGYASGCNGESLEHLTDTVRLELGRALTARETDQMTRGHAAGAADRAKFVRDLGDGIPPGWDSEAPW